MIYSSHLPMSEAEGCVYFCLANFILAVVKLIFLGLSSGGQQLGTSQLRPQLLCLLPLQVDMTDGRVDGPEQHNNIIDTGDCSKLSSFRRTSSNLITSLIHDSFSALRSDKHFCASSTNFPTYVTQFPLHADLANARQPRWNVALGLLQYSDEYNLLLNVESHLSDMSQNTFKGMEY